jgi:hypothetical protein
VLNVSIRGDYFLNVMMRGDRIGVRTIIGSDNLSSPFVKQTMTDDELKQLIASNAKAIEALTSALTQEREERQKKELAWEKDRKGVYELLGRVARSQSDFYATQSDFYHRFDQIDERQAKMTEILNRYLPPESLS